MLYFCLFYTLCAVAFLLATVRSHRLFSLYTFAKAAASCGFISIAAASFFVYGKNHPAYFYLMLAAMVFCLGGDILLGLANNKAKFFGKFFVTGVLCFAVAHIGFSAAFSQYAPFIWLDLALPILSFFVTYFISKHESFRFKRMKIPALFYSVFVGLAAARAIAAAFVLLSPRGALMAVGAILFLISDASILFLYFTVKKPRRRTRAFNLITYYAGLICLALSCGFL